MTPKEAAIALRQYEYDCVRMYARPSNADRLAIITQCVKDSNAEKDREISRLRSEKSNLSVELKQVASHIRGMLSFVDGVSTVDMAKAVAKSVAHERVSRQRVRIELEKLRNSNAELLADARGLVEEWIRQRGLRRMCYGDFINHVEAEMIDAKIVAFQEKYGEEL